MAQQKVRTRFAPSPTGEPHIGNVRSALFAWLLARHNNGSFILRIEDTDVERRVEGSVEKIMDGLRWLGLQWDEGPEIGGTYGPYFQSQRLPMYKEIADKLITSGNAYKCYCSSERLTAMREQQMKRKLPPGYDRHCRNLTEAKRQEQEKAGIVPVIRFKMPLTGKTTFSDLIWGNVTFENSTLDDHIMMKSDGFPTYHLAHAVDDHYMEVSHVVRAEEWISSTPRHILLYEALNWEKPLFAHVPMVLGPDRSKLSKRHGATSALEFREQGYLPEALFNFLALVGWSLDDKTEIMSREQIIEHFSLDRVSKTAAIFNHEKLQWMNGVYMRKLSPEEFTKMCLPVLDSKLPPEVSRPLDENYVKKVIALVQERARTFSEVPELTEYFFTDCGKYDINLLISKGMTAESTVKALRVARERIAGQDPFEPASLEAMLRALAEELELKTGQLFGSLRTAVSGKTATPPLFQMMDALGKERTLARIDDGIEKLAGM